VGVTTIALNVARHLAEDTHRRVAYVDLNLNGGAANSMLGIQSNNGLSDVLQNVHRLDPQYVERTLVAKGSAPLRAVRRTRLRRPRPFRQTALRACWQLLCDSFHYVMLDIGNPADPLAAKRSTTRRACIWSPTAPCISTRETIRLLRFIEDRENNPTTSLLLNNPNAASAGKVESADFTSAVGRNVLHEIQFEAKAVSIAENLGEAPKDKAANGFNQSIMRIGSDLTGQHPAAERTFFQKLKLRRS
jgi:pilus assembly protein CpaE